MPTEIPELKYERLRAILWDASKRLKDGSKSVTKRCRHSTSEGQGLPRQSLEN